METADRIVVVVVVVVLSVRLRVWVLEELKESLVVGFDFGEVEVRGKRVKQEDEDEDETMALAVVGGDIGLVWFGLNQILMQENEYISEEDIVECDEEIY